MSKRRACCHTSAHALKSPRVGVRIKDPDSWSTLRRYPRYSDSASGMKEKGHPLSWKERSTNHSGETGGSDEKIWDAFRAVLVTKVPGETVFNYIVNVSGDGRSQSQRT